MQIEDALRGISSADNGTRTAWEAQIDSEMERNKDGLLMSLCASMAGGSSSNNALAAILFRRLSMRDGVWAALESSNREAIKDRLLKLVFYDSDLAWEARAKICDAIAEIRRIESCSWPALTSSISMISNTKDEQTSLAALRIIYECPESLVGEFDSRAAVNLLMQCPSHSKNLQLAIVRSFCAVLPLYASGGRPDDCRPFMPILENLAPLMDSLVLVGDDEDHLINFVGNLIGAVEECPKIFRSVLEPLLASCFRALAWPLDGVQSITDAYNFSRQNEDKCLVISSPDSAEEILELMVTLVEVSPRRIIKSPRIIECCLGTAMLTVALALGEDWDNKSNDEDEEEEELSLSAECAVDRISIAVSGSTNFAQSLISNINTMLISGSWQLQWAALRSLANAAEGAVDILRPSLHQIFGKIILPHLTTSNSHSPRVNYAACHALGQLATDFESSLRSDESLISTCLSALVTLLVSSECTRVQGHAAAALVNFAEGAEQRLLVPLLDPLMQRLLLLLNMSKENSINVKLVEQLISTVGAFAGATRKAFAPYAQPTLLCITSFLDVPDMSPSIQANCIETATIVLEATFSLLGKLILSLKIKAQDSFVLIPLFILSNLIFTENFCNQFRTVLIPQNAYIRFIMQVKKLETNHFFGVKLKFLRRLTVPIKPFLSVLCIHLGFKNSRFSWPVY